MERQRRMDKTLGCLVASMTFGALILYYTQPELPATQGETRFLIAEPNVWSAIHLDPEIVTADRPTSSAHFYVDQSGGWARTDLWAAQKGLDLDLPAAAGRGGPVGQGPSEHGQVIRIGLITPPGSHEISAEQHAQASALVKDLSGRFGISPESIIWDDTLNVPEPRPTSSDLRPEVSHSR